MINISGVLLPMIMNVVGWYWFLCSEACSVEDDETVKSSMSMRMLYSRHNRAMARINPHDQKLCYLYCRRVRIVAHDSKRYPYS